MQCLFYCGISSDWHFSPFSLRLDTKRESVLEQMLRAQSHR